MIQVCSFPFHTSSAINFTLIESEIPLIDLKLHHRKITFVQVATFFLPSQLTLSQHTLEVCKSKKIINFHLSNVRQQHTLLRDNNYSYYFASIMWYKKREFSKHRKLKRGCFKIVDEPLTHFSIIENPKWIINLFTAFLMINSNWIYSRISHVLLLYSRVCLKLSKQLFVMLWVHWIKWSIEAGKR